MVKIRDLRGWPAALAVSAVAAGLAADALAPATAPGAALFVLAVALGWWRPEGFPVFAVAAIAVAAAFAAPLLSPDHLGSLLLERVFAAAGIAAVAFGVRRAARLKAGHRRSLQDYFDAGAFWHW